MNLYKYFFISSIIFFLISCNPQNTNNTGGSGSNGHPITIKGYVKSIDDYSIVSNAEVIINNVKVLSDVNGYFSISINNVTDKDSIKVLKDGFVKYQRSLSNFVGHDMNVEFVLKPVDISIEIDPSKEGGNTITTLKKASVYLPKLSITRPLIVCVTSYDVGTEEINTIPGDFTALDFSNNERNIVSLGLIDVTVRDKETGEVLDLKSENKEFKIVVPITGDKNMATDTIPMWYFDEKLCKWVEEGTFTRSAGNPDFYEGTVTHFTPHNPDYVIPPINVYGIIDDLDASENYEIKLTSSGYNAIYNYSGNSFYITGVPQRMQMKISVRKMSTGEIWAKYFYSYNDCGCIYLGIIPGPNDLSEVMNLEVVVHDINKVSVSWTGEDPKINGVQINYYALGSTAMNSVVVEKGVKSYEISGLIPGPYNIIVRTFDEEGNESFGLTRKVRISDAYRFKVYNSNVNRKILYKYNDNPVFITCDSLEAILPNKTKITLDIDATGDARSNYYWQWGGNSGTNTFPIDFYIQDDDIDDIYLYYQGGSSNS